MLRLILATILFLLSLLILFRAPTNFFWYVSILVTEFSLLFIILSAVLIFWKVGGIRFNTATVIIGVGAICLFTLPYVQAYRMAQKLSLSDAFKNEKVANANSPFSLLKIFSGLNAGKMPFQTQMYDSVQKLNLDFYKSNLQGNRPCVIVIHGGSWAGGDRKQLPELNSELSKSGYHVAAINYRLAPLNTYPAPLQDVQSVLNYLRAHAASLSIDQASFILLGRSAGGQIALSAAYTLKDKSIRGVISFYGPTDMVWGYQNPTNPLVLNSQKLMEDYLGGTLAQVPNQYTNSSATETASTQAPPTLLLYGENDPLVSPRHGNRLSKKLKAAGVPFFELYLPWATHGFDYTLHGPAGQLSTWTVKRFLEKVCNAVPAEKQ